MPNFITTFFANSAYKRLFIAAIGLIGFGVLIGILYGAGVFTWTKEKIEGENTRSTIISPLPTSTKDLEVTNRFITALNGKYESTDNLVDALKGLDFYKVDEAKLINEKHQKALKSLLTMGVNANTAMSQLSDLSKDKNLEMTEKTRDALKEFVENVSLDDTERKKLMDNLNKTKIVEEPIIQDTGNITPEDVENLKRFFTAIFLKDINQSDFKVIPSSADQLKKITTLASLSEGTVSKLYAPESAANAIKLRGLAVTLVEVCSKCHGKGPNFFEHDPIMIDKIDQVKAYLNETEYNNYKLAFKAKGTKPTSPEELVEMLKTTDFSKNKLDPKAENILSHLKEACRDSSAKASNLHLNTLCGLLTELETLVTLLKNKQSSVNKVALLDHLLRLKQHSNLILDEDIDNLLNGSKGRVHPENIVTDYLSVANAPGIPNGKNLLNAATRLFELLQYLNLSAADQRISDLKCVKVNSPETLIVEDLSNEMVRLHNEAETNPTEKAAKDVRIGELFQALRAISDLGGITDVNKYLESRIATIKFDTEKSKLLADIEAKLLVLTWRFPTHISDWKTQIDQLIASKTANSIIESDLKANSNDTFVDIVKSNIVPKLKLKLKTDAQPLCTSGTTTFNAAQCNEWANLIREIKQIDSSVFDKVKSLNAITDQASLSQLLRLWNLNMYYQIVECDFVTNKLNLAAGDTAALIATLRTIQAEPQLVNMMKLDAIAGTSLTAPSTKLLANIGDIESAVQIINDASLTCSLAEYKILRKVQDLDVVAPFPMKIMKDDVAAPIDDFVSYFNAFYYDTSKVAERDKCLQVANDLILFKAYENVATCPIEADDIFYNRLFSRTFNSGLEFIRYNIEVEMSKKVASTNYERWWNLWFLIRGIAPPSPTISKVDLDSVDVTAYKTSKNKRLIEILNNAIIPFQTDKIPPDFLDHLCDPNNPNGLAKLRNDLFYSFDPVKPCFDKNESVISMKKKILEFFFPYMMNNVIQQLDLIKNEAYNEGSINTKTAYEFIRKYLSISPEFKASLPQCIQDIENGATLKIFCETHLPKADSQLSACIAAVAMNELRTAYLSDPPLPILTAIPALNKCIQQRLCHGLPTQALFQQIASSENEKDDLEKHAKKILIKEESKKIILSLMDRMAGTSANFGDDINAVMQQGDEVLQKFNSSVSDELHNIYISIRQLIGNQVLSKVHNQDEIDASITRIANFGNLPDIEEYPLELLRVDVLSELLPKFRTMIDNSIVPLAVRNMPTPSQALKADKANEINVREYWKYKLAIWCLANLSSSSVDLEKSLKLAKKTSKQWDGDFKNDVMALQRSPPSLKWNLDNDNNNIVIPSGKVVKNAQLFEFLNQLFKLFLKYSNPKPFEVENVQEFIMELITEPVIDIFRDAIIRTDFQFEMNNFIKNSGDVNLKDLWRKYVEANLWELSADFKTFAAHMVEIKQAEVLARFLKRNKLYDESMKKYYDKLLIELDCISLESQCLTILNQIDNSLDIALQFVALFESFNELNVVPDLLSAVKLPEYWNANTPQQMAKKKEVWDLYKKFMNLRIKHHTFREKENQADQLVLAFHQLVLIDLKHLELFEAINGTSKFIFGESHALSLPNKNTPEVATERIYLEYLLLVEQLKDKTLPEYESAFDSTSSFMNIPSIGAFRQLCTTEGTSLESLRGFNAYLERRRQLFGKDKFISEYPVQIAVNEVLGFLLELAGIQYGMEGNFQSISANVAMLFQGNWGIAHCIPFHDDNHGGNWYEGFIKEVEKVSKKFQEYMDSYNALLVEIDECEPLVDSKTAVENKLDYNFIFDIARRLYVLYKLPAGPIGFLADGAATPEERIQHCYDAIMPEWIRTVINDKDQRTLERQINDINSKGEYTSPSKGKLDIYVQWRRLKDLLGEIDVSTNPIIEHNDQGILKLDHLPKPNLKEEILGMPILSESDAMGILAGSFVDTDEVGVRRDKLFRAAFEKVGNLDDCPDLQEELAIIEIQKIWNSRPS